MLQVDSVLQKRKNVTRNVRKRYEYGIKMPVLFQCGENQCGFSGGCPFIGLTAFVLRWLLDVDIHTYYALYGLQNASTLLDGFHAVLCMKKRPTASFQFPSAASVCGAPFLFVKIRDVGLLGGVDTNSSCVSM